ncbi:MAG: helix-turn-helix domain-containing protein [Sphaerochaeta associata]|jgi:transcriptional regulator with XRE-family HTH domain|uniref:helix-turn-helix domain-containing protein n=1 Tax=Sphaerochaeta associata TaxID=1129264 RepID=UPI002B209C6D|nr:helix-turn-helix domain-containing protein [Sphaerochaeta associata]MEA5027390.1 helix-turn-helix domain-containing protein [Sphaerochaeta associata]
METISFTDVGNTIKKLLEKRSMTQQSLADAIGVSKQVMHKIINGNKAINVTEISAIATALGTTVDELLTPSGEAKQSDFHDCLQHVQNQHTREKLLLLVEVMQEILFLEEVVHAKHSPESKR